MKNRRRMAPGPLPHKIHRPPANRTGWRAAWSDHRFGSDFRFRLGGRIPGLLFLRGQQRGFSQQRPHPVAPDFGRGMKSAKGPDPGKPARQRVLKEPAHEIQRVQLNGSMAPCPALPVIPEHLAIGQALKHAIGGGRFEDVTGEIAPLTSSNS